MHSANLFVVAAALTGLATAVPHARKHAYLHGRSIELGATVAGRSIYDGKCGPGDTCGPGYCCSQWGYCGTTQDYCGAGCQAQYGSCGAGNGTSPSPSDGPSVSAPASAPATDSTTVAFAQESSEAAVPTLSFVSHAYVSALATSAANNPPQTTLATQASAPAPATAPGPQAPTAPSPNAPPAQPTYSSPAPAPSGSSGGSSGGSIGSGVYKLFTGNGAASAGWPDMSSWASFDSLWNANLPTMKISCTQFDAANNSDEENDEIKSAIQQAASKYGVDDRFILAIMMQESKGCTRVPTTDGGVRNPGLMQSHNGDGNCGTAGSTAAQNPCPNSEITQMIDDGVGGTSGTLGGPGLQQLLAGGTDAQSYYEAARKYNSGSIAPGGDLGQGVATHCYCSDIANRLMGWTTSATNCHL